MSKLIDMTGQIFGKLSVVNYLGSRNGRSIWRCKCECGNTRNISRTDLISGDRRSCGCSKRAAGTGSINKDGYIVHSHKGKLCYEHIEKAEKALGRKLPKGAQVHHVDENKSNNENKNLIICQDQAYHRLLHRRADAYNACGNAGYLKCRFCGEYDNPINLLRGGRSYYHSLCRNKYRREKYKESKLC